MLDAITVKELNFIPELKVGEILDETSLSQSMLENIVDSELTDKRLFTALVVDDSQPVRKQLEIELKMLGAKVQLSESGEQAIELCRENRYDIIFLDVMMPGIDGPSTLKKIRKNPEFEHTPAIFMTAKVQPEEVSELRENGAIDVIAKPFDPMELANTIKKIWENLD